MFFFFLFLETFYLYSVRDNEGWKWVWVETATAVKQCKRRQWIYSVCSLCLKYRYDGRASFRGGRGGGGYLPPLETLCPPPLGKFNPSKLNTVHYMPPHTQMSSDVLCLPLGIFLNKSLDGILGYSLPVWLCH